jgi:hypothetical protein
MAEEANRQAQQYDLAGHWASEKCPVLDGVIFGDGRVRLLRAEWQNGPNDRLILVVEPQGWTTLTELDSSNGLEWTEVCPMCSAVDVANNIRVLGGEGGLGSEGFVAVLRSDNGEIKWIAFCASSNPFEAVRVGDDHILAKSTLGTWWRFPLASPDLVTLD